MTEQKAAFSLGDNTLKLLSIAGPLLAGSLAITYDVGFFFGTGIAFFSFFSLSEHLVFALQLLPLAAIPPAIVLLMWFAVGWWSSNYNPMEKRGLGYKLTVVAYVIVPVIAGAWIQRLDWMFVYIILLIYVVAFFAVGRSIFEISQWEARVRIAVACGVAAAALILSFLIGFQQAKSILESKTASETIIVGDNKPALPVRLIRGGDRGVLFFSLDTKKVSFLRWESIKQIEAGSPSSELKHGD
jgi:hypothetical protein